MAKSRRQAETEEQEAIQVPVRTMNVTAGPCPNNPAHTQTKVYRTVDKTRFCKCNDCGRTWKVIGDAADVGGLTARDREFLRTLAEGLETALRVTVDDVEVIQVDAAEADEAAKLLQRLSA